MPTVRARTTAFFALLCLLSAPARASRYHDFRPGAKAMGMGYAFTAVADDPYAMFFNPAGTANTPYSQVGGSVGRLDSPMGPMSWGALTYLRPFEPVNTATVGSAYYIERQLNGGDTDIMLFHYSQELKAPALRLSRPLKIGGNFKVINNDGGTQGGGAVGLGFDGGVLLRSAFGLQAGLAVTELTSNVGVAHPRLSLATAYTWQRWLTAAVDVRVRKGLTELYPGLEAAFHQGLLKVRAGRGFQLDNVDQLAFGMGVNFSPVVLDVAVQFPTGGLFRRSGGYQASFNYRFGAPSFSGSFVGQAASQAETLKADILRLEEQKKSLEEQTRTAQTHREISDGEVRVLEQRVRELEDQYRLLQKKREELGYEIQDQKMRQRVLTAPPPEAPKIPAPEAGPKPPSWPKRHVARAGDTLRTLSKQYYGDANLWEQIYNANRDKIDRGLPQEGAELVIPEPRFK